MPNRVLRESILDSDPVNSLGWPEEVFYRRLMSVVDDFGRYDARIAVLRSRLYPLQLQKVSESDVESWIAACVRAGLVSLYSHNGKPYLLFEKFKQHVRAETSKYPPPPTGGAVQTHCNGSSDALLVRSETYSETETEAHTPLPPSGGVGERWKKFWAEYPKKTGREAAWQAFRDIDPDEKLLAAMLAGLARAKRSADWQREEGRFIPKAAAWLADGRWEEHQRRPANRTEAGPDPAPEEIANGVKTWKELRGIGAMPA